MHTRIAAKSPPFAISIALRAIASVALEQVLHKDGRLVARSARPAGRIAALAFLKLHDLILLSLGWTKAAARGAHAPVCSRTWFVNAAMKKARGG